MRTKTCFFIGHRDAPDVLCPLLSDAVERHIIEYGVTEFIVGHYGRFDAMAASAVRKAKERHPEVTLTLLIPYYPPTCDTSDYDCTYYPEGMENVPRPFAIVKANEHMIRHCSFLICYSCDYIGNTRRLVEYAKSCEKRGNLKVENLADLNAVYF
ncbi:MAG: hypothetical protein E7427_09475 [Ruminococcaceae bacterium]|nr:hypothetical protein [Oscillospiraceae bacterium]